MLLLAVGVGKLHRMTGCSADVLGLDWSTDMADARQVLGSDRVIQGNVDPAVLFASEACPKPCVMISVHRQALDTKPLYLPVDLPPSPLLESSGLKDHLWHVVQASCSCASPSIGGAACHCACRKLNV